MYLYITCGEKYLTVAFTEGYFYDTVGLSSVTAHDENISPKRTFVDTVFIRIQHLAFSVALGGKIRTNFIVSLFI